MIAIIDYNSGNIASVCNALERLSVTYEVTSDKDKIQSADKVIFPGVGRAAAAMDELQKRGLDKTIPNIRAPFLGICLGMQLLSAYSEEDDTKCLDIIPGKVKRFPNFVKIPQIGWNKVKLMGDSPLFSDVPDESYFYFVNSFYLDTDDDVLLGQTDYGVPFASVIQKDNFYATQFHPEKSGEIGEKLFRNFIELC